MKRSIHIGAIVWVLLFALPVCAQDQTDDIAVLKQQNAELRAELARVQKVNDALQAEVDQLRAELTKLTMAMEDLEVEKRELTELAGLTPSGDRVEVAASRFTTKYDDAADTTTVRSGIEKLHVAQGSAADHVFSLAYHYPGKQMQSPPDDVMLYIQARYSGGVYRDVTEATLDIDGQTVTIPIEDYAVVSRKVRVGNKHALNKGDETITLKIDRDLLRQLARAIQLKITLGQVQLEPTRDQTALFRAVRKRIELGA